MKTINPFLLPLFRKCNNIHTITIAPNRPWSAKSSIKELCTAFPTNDHEYCDAAPIPEPIKGLLINPLIPAAHSLIRTSDP